MDATALENEALEAISATASPDEVEEVRVRFLGRKAELPQALREVRDRETGMTLNALRQRLEEALDGRRETLERAELDRRLREERIDVTLPGEAPRRGHLHLITQIRREVEDIFLGLGYQVVDGREVETTHYNFDGAQLPARPSGALAAADALPRRRDGASHARRRRARSGRWRRSSRRSTSSRSAASTGATRRTRRTRRPSTRSRGSRSTRGSRSPTSKARSTTCSRRSSARRAARSSARTTSRSPSRRSRPTSRATSATAAGCPVCRHSGWIEVGGAGMVDPAAVRVRRLRPRAVHRLRLRLGARADRRAAARDSRPARALAQRSATLDAVLGRAGPTLLAARVRRRRRARRTSSPGGSRSPRSRSSGCCRDGRLRHEREPRPLPGRQGRRGGQAPERRPAPALPGRRRRGRAAADRLRRLELRRRRDGGGGAAGSVPARGRRAAR